mmetsp:Transcript_115931/g.247757  ORF Transcript_115931/g.247757 Transcript_115931/m.247757 type:complete len:200 (+) Transcript_115931:708-1307(+)
MPHLRALANNHSADAVGERAILRAQAQVALDNMQASVSARIHEDPWRAASTGGAGRHEYNLHSDGWRQLSAAVTGRGLIYARATDASAVPEDGLVQGRKLSTTQRIPRAGRENVHLRQRLQKLLYSFQNGRALRPQRLATTDEDIAPALLARKLRRESSIHENEAQAVVCQILLQEGLQRRSQGGPARRLCSWHPSAIE